MPSSLSFFLFLSVQRVEKHGNYYFITLKTIKAEIFSKIPQQKVVGHHLYHATVSQVQPQLMAIRVFLLKPREIIIIYYLSDYQIKLTSTAVSLRENIPFQSLTHFQAFKNPTTL